MRKRKVISNFYILRFILQIGLDQVITTGNTSLCHIFSPHAHIRTSSVIARHKATNFPDLSKKQHLTSPVTSPVWLYRHFKKGLMHKWTEFGRRGDAFRPSLSFKCWQQGANGAVVLFKSTTARFRYILCSHDIGSYFTFSPCEYCILLVCGYVEIPIICDKIWNKCQKWASVIRHGAPMHFMSSMAWK